MQVNGGKIFGICFAFHAICTIFANDYRTKTMKRIYSILLLACWTLMVSGQSSDSMQQRMDSLQRELHEMKMKELVLRNALDESGHAAREDSIRKAEQKQRIDSLRQVTPGVPLVIEGDTLLYISYEVLDDSHIVIKGIPDIDGFR